MKYLFQGLMLVSVLHFMPLKSLSQDDILRSEHSLIIRFGAGIDLAKVRDTEFSKVLYSGLVPSFNLNVDFGKTFHQQVNLGYAIGNIEADNAQENSAKYTSFSADYFISKSAKYAVDKRWYGEPGAGLNFIFSERRYESFINQNNSKEYIGSLSAYYNVTYILSETGGWAISDRIYLPIISVIAQPEIWQPTGEEPNSISNRPLGTNVYFIPDYFRINNTISLSKAIDEKHSFRLMYSWDYFKIEEVYRKERISHSLVLSYQIKL